MSIDSEVENIKKLTDKYIVGVRISCLGDTWYVDVKREDEKFKPTFRTGSKEEIILKLSRLFGVNVKVEN